MLVVCAFPGGRRLQSVLLAESVLLYQSAEDSQQADQMEALQDHGTHTHTQDAAPQHIVNRPFSQLIHSVGKVTQNQ